MFIQTEATPNPATLKFLPGRTVLDSGTLEMRDRAEAAKSPLAERLFNIPGVGGVFLGSDFITVTKQDSEWPQLKPAILGIIMEHFMMMPRIAGLSCGHSESCLVTVMKSEPRNTPPTPGMLNSRSASGDLAASARSRISSVPLSSTVRPGRNFSVAGLGVASV